MTFAFRTCSASGAESGSRMVGHSVLLAVLMLLLPSCRNAQDEWDLFVKYTTKRDHDKATHWLLKAAEHGHAKAQWHIGFNYYNGGEGFPQSYAAAAKWYAKAADQGYTRASYALGQMYFTGLGVPLDSEKSFELLLPAAQDDYRHAQYLLGCLYKAGRGVSTNLITAAKWFSKAAEQGDPDAMLALGNAYRYGDGVPQNFSTALKWYTGAADKNLREAQFALAQMYTTGQGVNKDIRKAHDLYLAAAQQGHAHAQWCVAFDFYNAGFFSSAYVWASLAARDGDETSVSLRDMAASELDPASLQAAQNRAEAMHKELSKHGFTVRRH